MMSGEVPRDSGALPAPVVAEVARLEPGIDPGLPGPEAAGPEAAPAAAGHKRRRPGPVVKALMVLTLLGFIAPFIALIIAHAMGSGSGRGVFPVTIHNDGTTPLVLRTCGTGCGPGDHSVVLTAASTAQVAVSDHGTVTRYYLIDSAGSVVGCLPLRFTSRRPGVTVQVSQAVPCPGDPIPIPSGQ